MAQQAGWKGEEEARQRSSRAARPLRAESFGLSRRGTSESENQDRFLTATFGRWASVEHSNATGRRASAHDVLTSGQGHVMMVADGMGGPGHGAFASQLVIESLYGHLATRSNWAADPAANADRVLDDLQHALRHAHRELVAEACNRGLGAAQAGTTIVVGVIAWPLLLLAHAGDSRCYLHRAGALRCLTQDHTMGADLRRAYAESRADASMSSRSLDYILTSALLNSAHEPRIDVAQVHLREGDAILMCTDGLSQNLAENDMAELLAPEMTAQAMCEALLAGVQGSHDNATVVASKILRA